MGANSPNLCPTMSSVTNTGRNFLPLCTANVSPTNSGRIVDLRDHVLMIFLLIVPAAFCTFFNRCSSTKGPFFNDLGKVFLPLDSIYTPPGFSPEGSRFTMGFVGLLFSSFYNKPVARLSDSGPVALGRNTPGGHRMTST